MLHGLLLTCLFLSAVMMFAFTAATLLSGIQSVIPPATDPSADEELEEPSRMELLLRSLGPIGDIILLFNDFVPLFAIARLSYSMMRSIPDWPKIAYHTAVSICKIIKFIFTDRDTKANLSYSLTSSFVFFSCLYIVCR